ncbi:hypothetical protein ABEW05_005042 [Botrytis cinerea]
MAYNPYQSTVVSDDDEDDSTFVNEAYRPCKLLYVTTSNGVHSLRTVGPNYRIQLVKSRFIALLMKRGVISHYGYDCALSYGGRELADSETLESCRIGDEATVNAVVWEQNLNSPGFSNHTINSSLRIGHENEHDTKQSKRVRGSLDLVEEDEYEDRVLWRAPASKKQKSVRFADQDDPIPHPPISSRSSLPSQNPSSKNYAMSGILEPTDKALEFRDSLVRDIPPRDLPRRRPLVELPRAIIPKTPLRSPNVHRNSVREPETIRASYDAFEYPIRLPDSPRSNFHRNYDMLRYSDRTSHNRMEYGSSSAAVRYTPKLPNGHSLTSHSFPAVRNTVYVRPTGTGPTSRSSPPSPFLGSLNSAHVTATLPPNPYQPLFPPTSQEIPSFKPKSPTRQNPSFKDSLSSYAPLPSGSPSISNLFIHQYLLSEPSYSSSRPIFKTFPTSTSQHQPSNPYFLRSTPSSNLQSLNSYFLTPSLSPQPFQLPSVLQKLNPYFSNTSPPPPRYPSTPTPSHSPSGSPQSTKKSVMDFDYFQAARYKRSSSLPKLHPLNYPLPSPPPPPPTRPSRSPRFHTPSPYRPSSPNREEKQKQKQKQYQSPCISPFYDCYPLPSKNLSDPLATSSHPTPDSTYPLTSTEPLRKILTNYPATRSTTSKQSYYSSNVPLSTGSSLKGAIVIPSLAHEMLPKDFLAYRTVRQLIELQGWEMSEGEWRSVREVLKRCKRGENGARANMEVLAKGVVELEENGIEMS